MTILLSIIWTIVRNDWRYITTIGAIMVLVGVIYHAGYKSCETQVAESRAKAIIETQAIANREKQELTDENTKELIYAKSIESKLDAEIKKNKQYTDCILTPDAVLLLNEDDE